MTLAEARSIVTAYLVGRPVSAEELQEAAAVVRSDPATRRHLARELGGEEKWISECDVALARLAEFSGSLDPEREMPRVAAHLRECGSCRKALWSVKPLWIEPVLSPVRALASVLRVKLAAAGQILDAGWGPPSMVPALAAVMGDEPGAEPTAQRVWDLTDEETGYTLRLSLTPAGSGGVKLACSAQRHSPGASSESIRLEVAFDSGERSTERYLARGPIEQFERSPIPLPPGSWRVRLRRGGGMAWEIPIVVEAPE